jgi:hypothetical protein
MVPLDLAIRLAPGFSQTPQALLVQRPSMGWAVPSVRCRTCCRGAGNQGFVSVSAQGLVWVSSPFDRLRWNAWMPKYAAVGRVFLLSFLAFLAHRR